MEPRQAEKQAKAYKITITYSRSASENQRRRLVTPDFKASPEGGRNLSGQAKVGRPEGEKNVRLKRRTIGLLDIR